MRRSSVSRYRLPVLPHHPFIGTVVLRPHEAMAHDLELAGASELDEAIGGLEVPGVFGRVNALGFHAVFGREDLEVLPDQPRVFRLLHHPKVDADADLETVTNGFLQRPSVGLRPSGGILFLVRGTVRHLRPRCLASGSRRHDEQHDQAPKASDVTHGVLR